MPLFITLGLVGGFALTICSQLRVSQGANVALSFRGVCMNNLYKKMLMCVNPYIAEYFYVLHFSIHTFYPVNLQHSSCMPVLSEWKTV